MDPTKIFQDIEEATDHGKKRLSIEQIYQKKSQLEHILLRPDTYIGSVEMLQQQMWIYNNERQKMECREISYVPGLYKIFDEIVVNAADNKQRDKTMTCIRIDIDADKNRIRVWNNGRGIPVVEHKHEKMYVPELIFGTLLTSSNYDDSERKVTGGRNGYGAKLCNIFSKKFTVETSSREYKKSFKQTWTENMSKTDRPDINKAYEEDFTCVTFEPDLKKFKMDRLDEDIVSLMSRRAFDVAGTTRGVKVYLNGKKLPIQGFKDYVDHYTKDILDESDQPIKIVYEQCSQRWEVAVTTSEKGFQQISFVNSIATTKGGRHVDHVVDQIIEKMIENIKKQLKKTGMNIKPFQVKNHMWVFVNSLIENPTFDSQTKETMTLQAKSFGSKCTMSEKFLTQAMKCGVVDKVLQWVQFKAQTDLNKKCHTSKHSKLRGIAKLEDANDAGTKNSIGCTLILTEGDSAKTLAVAGLGVIGRDRYGVFPLRGKVLNVREATHKQIMENAEVNNIIKILGLQYKKKYQTMDDMHSLRYGKVMIMTDQDQDGSHIKGLLINFIHHNWPSLIKQNFVEEFITPIVKVNKGDREISFFSLPEYEEWKQNTKDWNTWKVKYYKGLGTSTSKEAREYFGDLVRHKIPFKYGGDEDDKAIELAFSKQKIEDRKTWLMRFMAEKKRRKENNLPDVYLYEKDTRKVSYKDFIDKELILFSNMDNERSIPSLVDGLKPGQRKVLFTCLKRNDKREVKVAQLAGSVAEMSAYHHGENSLMGTIIVLAQDFVGSNNINFLLPKGQFGSRLAGGKDSASPRYIFTLLNPVTRTLFHTDDDPILEYLTDDNKRIEPFWYCPIIPTVLVNGAEGIGTGWSTKIPCFNPRDLVKNVRRMIDGEDPLPMQPWYKNFKGDIVLVGQHRYVTSGVISVGESMDGKHDIVIEISELPIGVWTNVYKETVLEAMLISGEKSKEQKIQGYKEYQTDTTVRFLVYVTRNQMDALEAEGLHKAFKLQSTVASSNMILFDAYGCLKRYETACDILRDFYPVRLMMYEKRKEYLLSFLKADVCRLTNMARFIVEKITNVIKTHCKIGELAKILVSRKYDPDPIKRWKAERQKLLKAEDAMEAEAEAEDDVENTESAPGSSKISTAEIRNFRSDYGYLVNMPILNETEEFKEHLLKDRDKKQKELEVLTKKTIKEFWTEDLDAFLEKLEKREAEELAESQNLKKKGVAAGGKEPGKTSKNRKEEVKLQNLRLVEPVIDPSLKEKFDKADVVKENRVKGIKHVKKDTGGKKATKRQPGKSKEEADNSIIVEEDENRSDDELQDILNDSNIFQSKKAKEILSSTEKPKKVQNKKAAASTNGGLKQKTMHDFSGKVASKKKDTAKIESDDESIFNIEESDIDDDEDFVTSLKKRPNTEEPKLAKKPTTSRKKKVENGDNHEEKDDVIRKGPAAKKQKLSPKKTKQSKKVNSDSETGSVDDDDIPLPVSRPARVRKNVVYNFDQDDDDDEEGNGNSGSRSMKKNRIMDNDSDVESFEPTIDDDDDDSDFEEFSRRVKKTKQ